MKNKAVVVTTEFRGVFFGHVVDDKKLPDQITLKDVRNCIYWHESIGGFLGLSSVGPNDKCRIGAQVPKLTLYKVTSVSPVTPEAEKRWKA